VTKTSRRAELALGSGGGKKRTYCLQSRLAYEKTNLTFSGAKAVFRAGGKKGGRRGGVTYPCPGLGTKGGSSVTIRSVRGLGKSLQEKAGRSTGRGRGRRGVPRKGRDITMLAGKKTGKFPEEELEDWGIISKKEKELPLSELSEGREDGRQEQHEPSLPEKTRAESGRGRRGSPKRNMSGVRGTRKGKGTEPRGKGGAGRTKGECPMSMLGGGLNSLKKNRD